MAGSLALHGILFAWLLHASEPHLLTPTSVAIGHNGRVLTQIYFPSRNPDDSATNSSETASQVYRHQRLGHDKLTFKPSAANAKISLPRSLSTPQDNSETATLSKLGHGASAGL